jgi:tungstate transport system substrate-binding protein
VKKLRFVVMMLLLVTLVAGCTPQASPAGETPTEAVSAPEATNTVAAEPETVPPTPTAMPEPTAEPTEEPEPTAEPTAEPAAEGDKTMILATTTSTDDSGLLDYILPDFTEKTGITVEVVAVGTGQAIQLGVDGNADVLLVHDRKREDAYMAEGNGTRREDVMYNDFVIVGPESDPAGIAGTNDAAAAFTRIAETESTFVSRGDDSGTHGKEKAIWKAAGIEPAGDWYISAGQGMSDVLTMTEEQQGYTLSDRATYLSRLLTGYTLKVAVEGDPVLFNPYGVMDVNPDKGDHIKAEYAQQFIDWITSPETKELIASFGVEEFGAPLFTPQ